MATISAINPTQVKPTATPTKQQPVKDNAQLNIRDILLVQAVPLVAGGGYSAKTYFDNRGKAVVYEDMMKVFAEGTAEHKGLENALKLAKNNMKDAKKGGIILATTMALTTAWMLIANACCKKKEDAPVDKLKQDTIKIEPKLITNA